jgi:hypothetical protein
MEQETPITKDTQTLEQKTETLTTNLTKELDFHILQHTKAKQQVKLYQQLIDKTQGALEALAHLKH